MFYFLTASEAPFEINEPVVKATASDTGFKTQTLLNSTQHLGFVQ